MTQVPLRNIERPVAWPSSRSTIRRSTASATRCAATSSPASTARPPTPRCDAIVITGAGKTFSGGADIREFNTPKALAPSPRLHTLIRVIEGARQAGDRRDRRRLHGRRARARAGVPLSRRARRDAPIALPEVKLGLLPGAGGTQRLPRAVGVESGAEHDRDRRERRQPRNCEDTALFDDVVDGDVVDGALALARTVVAEGRPAQARARRRARLSERRRLFPVRAQHGRRGGEALPGAAPNASTPSPRRSRCRSTQGLRYERELFRELMQTPESRALRHAFFAERAAARIPGVPGLDAVRARSSASPSSARARWAAASR